MTGMIKSLKEKYTKIKNTAQYERGLMTKINSSFNVSSLYITDSGELTMHAPEFKLVITIPKDPVLQKVYAKRGKKTNIKDFMENVDKNFYLNGQEIKLSCLTGDMLIHMIANEMKKREKDSAPSKREVLLEKIKSKVR